MIRCNLYRNWPQVKRVEFCSNLFHINLGVFAGNINCIILATDPILVMIMPASNLQFHNFIFNGIKYQANTVLYFQFFKQLIAIAVNCAYTYKHLIRNFFIGKFSAGKL